MDVSIIKKIDSIVFNKSLGKIPTGPSTDINSTPVKEISAPDLDFSPALVGTVILFLIF